MHPPDLMAQSLHARKQADGLTRALVVESLRRALVGYSEEGRQDRSCKEGGREEGPGGE